MGNQLGSRCVTPCNPTCCATLCLPGGGAAGAGRDADAKHILANATSVLSVTAEEIAMDDRLEEELANEVEFWRMETSTQRISSPDFGRGHAFGAEKEFHAPFEEYDSRVSLRDYMDAAGLRQESTACSSNDATGFRPQTGTPPGAGARDAAASVRCDESFTGRSAAVPGQGPSLAAAEPKAPAPEDGAATARSSREDDGEGYRSDNNAAEFVVAEEGRQALTQPSAPSTGAVAVERRSYAETSSDSSEETFVGFIEDPAERALSYEARLERVEDAVQRQNRDIHHARMQAMAMPRGVGEDINFSSSPLAGAAPGAVHPPMPLSHPYDDEDGEEVDLGSDLSPHSHRP
eukprot:TRINITY_DN2232_c0_g1_i2.p1 TRINITY_DN2232_c0_g1~~TRINITY_DN2232_c0_g1_i2.p1  ORF type:complete len:348 (-),score=53.13 TRINITY_DN2232_c0_g1_i2:1030-2073(-)